MARERSEGHYVEDGAISQTVPLGPANAMRNDAPKFDTKHNRKIFAVITKAGETDNAPKKSEAAAEEKDQGVYTPDKVFENYESTSRRQARKDDYADQALWRVYGVPPLVCCKHDTKSELPVKPYLALLEEHIFRLDTCNNNRCERKRKIQSKQKKGAIIEA
ncbi:hypothetical protein QGP82_06310 [Leptothoe sp. LEGE 181152]|nr:hypothetical protein [Leptothoe sp. LEGE 181152]